MIEKLRYERVPAKLSKASVEYTDNHGDSPEQCSKCAHYIDATTCQIVAGRIHPEGWCDRFKGREGEYAEGGRISYEQPPLQGVAPRGSVTMPHDVVRTLGNGDAGMGHAVLSATVGQHPLSAPTGAVHPDKVSAIGGGSFAAGKRVLEKFAGRVRALRERPLTASTMRSGKFLAAPLHYKTGLKEFLPGAKKRDQ